MSSLSDVKQLGSALSQVTLVKEEVTLDIQVRKTHNIGLRTVIERFCLKQHYIQIIALKSKP